VVEPLALVTEATDDCFINAVNAVFETGISETNIRDTVTWDIEAAGAHLRVMSHMSSVSRQQPLSGQGQVLRSLGPNVGHTVDCDVARPGGDDLFIKSCHQLLMCWGA
jgi:hypothetical protein